MKRWKIWRSTFHGIRKVQAKTQRAAETLWCHWGIGGPETRSEGKIGFPGAPIFIMLLLLLLLLLLCARGLRSWSAEQGKKVWEKRKKEKSGSAPPPRALLVWREKKKKKITRRIHISRRYASRQSRSVSHPYKDSYDSSARPMGVASQNSTLPCAIATFPVSLPLSSPGDVWPCLPLLASTRP